MRLRRLDLIRYGHFTDCTLPLQPGLNIVFGANEAGKSTTLRALRQLLFGFDHRCADGFAHPLAELRIGAELQDEDGEILQCIRRKAQVDALRGPDDMTVIPAEQLQQMLDGVEQPVFQQRFGIDYDQLVKGGREICAGQGDLGEILFAAASGIASFHRVQQKLIEQAGLLFKQSGSKPDINVALAELREKKKQIKAATLSSKVWESIRKDLQQTQAELDELVVKLREIQIERQRLERLQKAIPLLARLDQAEQQLRAFETMPLLADSFALRQQQAIHRHDVARRQQQQHNEQLQQLAAQIAALSVPDALLARAGEISQLLQDLGTQRKRARDKPKLAAEIARIESEIADTLNQLGPEASRRFRPSQLTAPQEKRILALVRQREKLLERRETQQARHAELAGRRAELDLLTTRLPQPIDVEPLRKTLARVRTRADLPTQLQRLQTDIQSRRDQLQKEYLRLGAPGGTMQQFANLVLPSSETIQLFDAELIDLHQQLKLAESQLAQNAQRLRDTRTAIEQLRLIQDVPTEEDLADARRLRDEGWQLVRQAWQQPPIDAAALDRFVNQVGTGDLAEAFAHVQQQADQVADRMRREAQQVAQKAQLQAQERELVNAEQQLRQNVQAAQRKLTRRQDEWESLWNEIQVAPRTPREMRQWRDRCDQLLDNMRSLQVLEQDEQQIGAELHEHTASLVQQLEIAGIVVGSSRSFAALVDVAESSLQRYEQLQQQRQQLERDVAIATREETELVRQQADLTSSLEQWSRQWSECMRELGLPESALPEEVGIVLDATRHAQDKLREARDLKHRIEGMQAEDAEFQEQAQKILQLVAPQLLQQPLERAVELLNEMLGEASKVQARRSELQAQHDKVEQRLKQFHDALVESEAELRLLCVEAGCRTAEELPAAVQGSQQRREAARHVADLQERLMELAAGSDLATLRAETAGCQPDQLAARVADLALQAESLQQRRDELNTQVGSARNELARSSGGSEAAELEVEAASLRARIRERSEQYARLKLAAAVLRETAERYRQRSQGPVLERASELFAHLTLGAFSQLRVESNDKGELHLVGVRPQGRPTHVRVEQMSSGASDQLYLALRVASLEHYFQTRRPIPFIVDDILIMFDDERSIAALRVLAELGTVTQVIFFTHHQHLLDLATEHLAHGTYSINHLQRSSAMDTLTPAHPSAVL